MSKLAFTKKDNYTRCMNSAIYSLAMREHSRLELFNKLKVKDFSEGVDLDKLLDELTEITNELQRKGIQQSLIQLSMDKNEIDWYEIATAQLQKKYGNLKPSDYKEKAKRMRFLSSRGFDAYIIRDIVDS